MRALALAVLMLATAACGPSTGMPLAAAQPPAVAALWPAPAAGAADGQVYEYH
jgi:hypothetical protein